MDAEISKASIPRRTLLKRDDAAQQISYAGVMQRISFLLPLRPLLSLPSILSMLLLLFLLGAFAAAPVRADAKRTTSWYQTERSLGVANCVTNNNERPYIRVESVSLDRKSISLTKGQATQLVPAVKPANAANQAVSFKSSNKKVAKVTKAGWVTARGSGSCRITATTADGSRKAVCTVTVKNGTASGSKTVKTIQISKTSLTIYTGQRKQLSLRVRTPLASTPVSWSSSNGQVASVDAYGRVTGLRGGTAVISARSMRDGKTVSCRVTVKGRYPISRLSWQIRFPGLSGTYSGQGSGVDNGTFFKMWNYNTVQLYDFSTGAKKGEFKLDTRHGNIIDFDTGSAQDGPYHDAYVTAETNPAMVNVYKFSDSGAERLRTYIFPLSRTGYNAAHILDPVKRLLYLVGYTKNSFYNPAGNTMIVSIWDITSTREVAEGFFEPAFVRSFSLPFMLTLQGECLHNGKLYIMSSDWVNPQTVIYVVDPDAQATVQKMEYFPTEIKNLEMESIFFIGDTLYMDKNQYIYRITP